LQALIRKVCTVMRVVWYDVEHFEVT
jgi:hypothetical protein